jgi:outer membrane receptor protein involved in Fe transport
LWLLALPCGGLVSATGWSATTEEIVVTTRRREENLQEVPIAITAISAEQIERQGIRNMFDIAQLDPSVQMDAVFSPSDTKITIRGLSNTRGRSNVAILVDGIDVTSENLGLPGSGMLANVRLLSDVERIEIVKGPQSALFGRAAFAGAISYTTKDPTDEFDANIGVDLAEYNQRQLNISFSGPMGNKWGYRVDGVVWKSDGFYTNSISGEDVGGGEGTGLSGTLKWEPTDALAFKARLAYSEDEYMPRAQVRVPAMELELYPQEVLDAGIGEPGFWLFRHVSTVDSNFPGRCPGVPEGEFCDPDPTTDLTGSRGLTLKNHGRFCPNNPLLDDRGPNGIASPGMCLTSNLGDIRDPRTGKDYVVTHSENVFTGKDHEGNTQDILRFSLRGDWDLGYGTFTSLTGYTDADDTDSFDTDYEAIGRPDRMISNWAIDRRGNTEQFSQELRFTSSYEGPVNFTAGALYWSEKRSVEDANFIISCLPVARDRSAPDQNGVVPGLQLDPEAGPLVMVPNVCDGSVGGLFPQAHTVGGANTDFLVWQPMALQLARPGADRVPPVDMNADTDHYSFYLAFDWQINDQLNFTFEDRFVKEKFSLDKPNQSSCDKLGFPVATTDGNGQPVTRALAPLLDENSPLVPANFENLCTWENQEWDGQNTWEMVSGSSDSTFQTPKVTLEWMPSDQHMFYFSFAKAQKPGGISTFISGGRATSIDDERFDSEKMDAWEIGGKMSMEAAGYLQFNFATFFQDYKDKQVGTQVLVDGILTPKIENAAAAEVYGVELDIAWQPEVINGLTLSAAYTWLDPTFTDFMDDTTSIVRAAENGGCAEIVYKDAEGPDPDDLSDSANGGPNCRLDLSGKDLEYTPRNAFVAAINVNRPLASTGLNWVLDINTSYQDKRFESADNYLHFDEYWLTNVRLGLQGDRWDILFYVDNIMDDDTLKSASSAPDFGRQVTELGFLAGLGVSNTTATLPDPRVFGLRANFSFGN